MTDHIRESLIAAIESSGKSLCLIERELKGEVTRGTLSTIMRRTHHPTTTTASILADYFEMRLR